MVSGWPGARGSLDPKNEDLEKHARISVVYVPSCLKKARPWTALDLADNEKEEENAKEGPKIEENRFNIC